MSAKRTRWSRRWPARRPLHPAMRNPTTSRPYIPANALSESGPPPGAEGARGAGVGHGDVAAGPQPGGPDDVDVRMRRVGVVAGEDPDRVARAIGRGRARAAAGRLHHAAVSAGDDAKARRD